MVSIRELTSRDAVLEAIQECDRLGRDAFLREYGFRREQGYALLHRGKSYDSKAIAGVAYGFQFPSRGALRPAEFVGGVQGAATVLRRLGFVVTDPAPHLSKDRRFGGRSDPPSSFKTHTD